MSDGMEVIGYITYNLQCVNIQMMRDTYCLNEMCEITPVLGVCWILRA